MPYCFYRSSIKFHMGPKINDLKPIISKNTRPVAAIKSLRFALLSFWSGYDLSYIWRYNCMHYFWVSKMNAVARAQLTLQMLTSISPEPVFKNMGQQMSDPASSNGLSIQHESEGWGLKSLSGRDIFVSTFLTLSQEHPCLCRKWMLLPVHSYHLKCYI